MARIPDGFIDLTVTSPPYDNLRAYNGYSFDFEAVAKELYNGTKSVSCGSGGSGASSIQVGDTGGTG